MSVDFKIIKSDNPLDYKDRMIELQNMYSEVADKLTIARVERDSLKAGLEYIKDQSFKLADRKRTVEERKCEARTDIEVEIPYVDGGEEKKELMTYHKCKYLLLSAESKVGSIWLNLEELKSAIAVCQMYPTRGV